MIVFAGPGVDGAIRNQFNLVGNTVNNGTVGGVEGGASGGGSAGTDSATVQAAIAKDAKNWTLEEQKAVAEDIAAKGEASSAFAKAEAAMDAGTRWSVKLTNGNLMTYRIIGINHDDLADGSGKAGLTFFSVGNIRSSYMYPKSYGAGSWEDSDLRAKMNSGEIWNLMPSDFQSKVKSVRKLTNNSYSNDKNATVTATADKLFLLSYSEIVESPESTWSDYSWIGNEGSQYEYFRGKVAANDNARNDCLIIGDWTWWERTSSIADRGHFLYVSTSGKPSFSMMSHAAIAVVPAFCFYILLHLEQSPCDLARAFFMPILKVMDHLSTDQVNYWNKYSDTLVRYSRYICVNRRDKYSLYSAVYQLRVCRFISRY